MSSLVPAIGLGVVAFVSTNIDDMFVVSAFFADPSMHPRSVVLGQFLGIGVLVLASAVAALLALAVPKGWVSLMGLIPLFLGLQKLLDLRRTAGSEDGGAEERHVQDQAHIAERRTHSQVLAVAGVAIANGGDNIGVYVPLFVTTAGSLVTYTLVFACMTAVWCALGYMLVTNRVLGGPIRRWGHVVLPVVLVVLGLYILSGAAVLLH